MYRIYVVVWLIHTCIYARSTVPLYYLTFCFFQGTCLTLLNGLLVSEDDSDFLRTIIRIPSKPLLHYLEPTGDVTSESDSGCGNLRRDTLLSCTARSSSDTSSHVTQDEGVACVGSSRLEVPVSGIRASSINSEISESSSGRSLARYVGIV